MTRLDTPGQLHSRRQFFSGGKNLLGAAALAGLLGEATTQAARPLAEGPHFAPKAKRVIYLHMVGGPSQMDLFDYKPEMQKWYDKELPDSIRKGQRLTTMTSGQKRFPVAPSRYKFSQAGECGMWMNTEMLPNLAKKADEICWMRSLHTEAINHEPAIAAMQTGNQVTGRPCLGSWASYGLGTINEQLPAFVVLVAVPSNRDQEQAISSRLWSSGYLPGEHAGVSFRSKGDPILYIKNPPGVPDSIRKDTIDSLNSLNKINYDRLGDPETRTRIQQYEMAFRMQASVPELTDLSDEPDHVMGHLLVVDIFRKVNIIIPPQTHAFIHLNHVRFLIDTDRNRAHVDYDPLSRFVGFFDERFSKLGDANRHDFGEQHANGTFDLGCFGQKIATAGFQTQFEGSSGDSGGKFFSDALEAKALLQGNSKLCARFFAKRLPCVLERVP